MDRKAGKIVVGRGALLVMREEESREREILVDEGGCLILLPGEAPVLTHGQAAVLLTDVLPHGGRQVPGPAVFAPRRIPGGKEPA